MDEHPSTHWAVKLVATAGSDLNLAEKIALKAYKADHLVEVGPVARVSRLEILNRETGETSTFTFVGAGAGFGAGILSADITDKWHPFDTKNPITMDYFSHHAATLYNASAGLGFNWAPISGIRFSQLDVVYDSRWQTLWNGNGISFGGLTTLNAGTGLDVSEVVGALIPGKSEEGDPNIIDHLDEINQMCHDNGLPTVSTPNVVNQSTLDQNQSIGPSASNFGALNGQFVAWNQNAPETISGELAMLTAADLATVAPDHASGQADMALDSVSGLGMNDAGDDMAAGGYEIPFAGADFAVADTVVNDFGSVGDLAMGGDFSADISISDTGADLAMNDTMAGDFSDAGASDLGGIADFGDTSGGFSDGGFADGGFADNGGNYGGSDV